MTDATEPADRVAALLGAVVAGLKLEVTVEVTVVGDEVHAEIRGEDRAGLIGQNGETIDAIQHLAYKAASHGADRARVVVDAGGYREARQLDLERAADAAAVKAVNDGQGVALEAMGANDRKVVHEYLKARGDVETVSEGSEPNRYLVVRRARFM